MSYFSVVPVGRIVEKKEKINKEAVLNSTPIRNLFSSARNLNTLTISKALVTATAQKTDTKKPPKPTPRTASKPFKLEPRKALKLKFDNAKTTKNPVFTFNAQKPAKPVQIRPKTRGRAQKENVVLVETVEAEVVPVEKEEEIPANQPAIQLNETFDMDETETEEIIDVDDDDELGKRF